MLKPMHFRTVFDHFHHRGFLYSNLRSQMYLLIRMLYSTDFLELFLGCENISCAVTIFLFTSNATQTSEAINLSDSLVLSYHLFAIIYS